MQQKLCLWLAVAVLFGALLAGNPFLDGRVARGSAAAPPGGTAPPAAPQPMPGEGLLAPAMAVGTDGGTRSHAAPALAVSNTATLPAEASAELLCPDLELRPRVASVERSDRGELVWVLRDGTRWMRNRKSGAAQPLLIAADGLADAK